MESLPQTHPQESHILHPDLDPQEPSVQDPVLLNIERVQESEPKKWYKRIFRPSDLINERFKIRVRALAAAALVGIGGVTTTDNAEAGGIRGLEQTGKGILAGVVNEMILNKTGTNVRIDQQGNPVIVAKSPQEVALNLQPRFEPGVLEYAQGIGLNVINQGMIFQIQNNLNPAEAVSLVKYHNPTYYSTAITLSKAPGGGLLLLTQYIKNNYPGAQMVTIRTNSEGKMLYTVVGN